MYSGGYRKAEIHLRVIEDGHGTLFTTLLSLCCHNLSESTDYFSTAGFLYVFFSRAGWILLKISLYTDKVIFNFANEMNCWNQFLDEPSYMKTSYMNCMCGQSLETKSLWNAKLVGICSDWNLITIMMLRIKIWPHEFSTFQVGFRDTPCILVVLSQTPSQLNL